MTSLDRWWAESPFERRPELPARVDDHVPVELQFQRAAHDANLGKQTSDLMRLSPMFYQRFGATDVSLSAHLERRVDGLWEYLTDPEPYEPPSALRDIWGAMDELTDQGDELELATSIL